MIEKFWVSFSVFVLVLLSVIGKTFAWEHLPRCLTFSTAFL